MPPPKQRDNLVRRERRSLEEDTAKNIDNLTGNYVQTDSPLTSAEITQEEAPKTLTEEEKAEIKAEADRVYKTLNDYTFKLFGPCVNGTAWILDYQLRADNKYPTVWYMVTNAHVISNFRFSENPYKQILPHDHEITQTTRRLNNYDEILEKYKDVALDNEWRFNCSFPERFGYLDMNLSQGEEGVQRKADFGAIKQGKMKEPKLFFSAVDFLEENPNKDIGFGHYADFAVMEIEFNDSEYARQVTGDFATKYGVDSTDAINLFRKPLETIYKNLNNKENPWQALDELEENIYILAYPGGKRNKWAYTKNFSEDTGIASRLGGITYKDRRERYPNGPRGFVNSQNKAWGTGRTFWWGNKAYKEFGHYYELHYNPLAVGSSGGLFVDKDLGAIAVTAVTTIGSLAFNSWVLPLRSDGVTFTDHGRKIVTPKYDLILGAKGQKNSYREQVEEYIIKQQKKETWLSKRNWKHKTASYDELYQFNDESILEF